MTANSTVQPTSDGRISPAELRELRRAVDETNMLVRGVLQAIIGKEKTDAFEGRVYWASLDRENVRLEKGTPLWTLGIRLSERRHLGEFDNLEAVAQLTRDEVAGIKGLGSATMRRLDAAMADHGLTFAAEIVLPDGWTKIEEEE